MEAVVGSFVIRVRRTTDVMSYGMLQLKEHESAAQSSAKRIDLVQSKAYSGMHCFRMHAVHGTSP